MNPLESILHRAQKLISGGLERSPQDYLYLDVRSLHEHYQALTGTARIPKGTMETASATLGAEVSFGLKGGLSGKVESRFELSNYHLFESMEPELRSRYKLAEDAAGLEASLRGFAWLRGKLSWYQVGETHLYHVLEGPATVMLLCEPDWFSPFTRFFHQEPQLYRMQWEVDVLAYNPGILGQYGSDPHPKAPRSLAVVPTVIIGTDAGKREDIASFIKSLNEGELSRSPRPWFRREKPKDG